MHLDPLEKGLDLPPRQRRLSRPLGITRLFDRLRTPEKHGILVLAGVLLLIAWHVPVARAQDRNSNTANASDLAFQNLSRVAASAAEIKAILIKDAGLLVELKHWVARDATDHGQVITDSDLTNEGIFERLETNIQFRSVATALVQRYGYLLPKLNPDSDPGKEHELLLEQRAKWLAQNHDEELTPARPSGTQTPREVVPPGPQQGGSPSRTAPQEPDFSNPPGEPATPLPRAQLTQTAEDTASQPSQLPLPGSFESGPPFNRFNARATPRPDSQDAGVTRWPAAFPAGGISNDGRRDDGLLAAYGMGINPATGNLPEASAIGTAGNGPLVSPRAPMTSRSPTALFPEAPEMIRKQSPYESIPSLYDMYVQAVTRPETPRRFGADVFENGAQDSQLIPMDLPVGPDYVVGPGDGLSVDLWGSVSQRLYRVVDREGRVSLPEVGPLLVSGKSLAAVQESLQQILRTQFRDVSADVSLARIRTIRIYEVGDVTNPGAYDISSLSTPLNALFAAGGPTPRGSMRMLNHYRGTQLVETVDLYDLLLHGVKTNLQRLENGDTVQIPPIGPEVTIEGMVRRPAIYELREEKTLAGVLEMAGGLLPAAALSHVEVQRLVAHDKQTMLSLDIPEMENAAEVTRKLESFEIQDGDRIRIFPIAPYNQDVIFVEGHVVRPGRYSYRPGMRFTDVLSSYKDLLPEPAAQYAEIIRLNAPDFHPTVESFRLADALGDPAHSPVLQAMDTVRIFSRFDFENQPIVSIGGGVRAPGSYRTSGQLRLADAIHLAGGLTPDAQTGDAQVFRYLPDGKVKIFSVGLGQALEGDPVGNIFLQPRDRLLVHRNPDAVEPATVYIQGEVAKPGRYPLAEGMRVSDLIRLGGGFKNSADREMADFTEYLPQEKAAGHGAQHQVRISAALDNTSTDNLVLHNGDTLTIRQLSGWNELGASVTVRGEVAHPGNYGIRPGERVSSVLARAGGMLATAYPQGIVFEREEVRLLEQKSREDLIQRIRMESASFRTSVQQTAQDQASLMQQSITQRNEEISALEQAPVTGRLVVRVPVNLSHFAGSVDDIEVRRGDTLFVPKRPEFVVVTGQVYNSNAITYKPRRNASWYLRRAGGATDQGNLKMVFIIRANGAVESREGSTIWNGGVLATVIEPGDTIVVPEKAVGGSNSWKNLIAVAQLAEAAATTAFIATH
jgi:protein involved in polysaccharide export with SLBB domain